MSESAAAAKRRQRRIPDEFRKRNAKSCDHCRKRRCRCVPAPSGDGCTACQEHNVTCTFTAPRKTRFYGSVDDLSDRYRCLEAIVKGAFPNEALSTVGDLHSLGQKLGYAMPDLAQSGRPGLKIEDLVRAPDSHESTRAWSSSTAEPSASRWHQDTSPKSERNASVTARSTTDPGSSESGGMGADEAHLSLIKDTSGNEHYIGPSGTLNFLSQLRRLIVSSSATPETGQSDGVSRFTQDDTAQALEANDGTDHQDEAQRQGGYAPSGVAGASDGQSPGSLTSSIARDFTRMPQADLEETLRGFPEDGVMELLIHSYFKNVHDDFPLFHRASFEDEYELYVVQGRRRVQVAPLPGKPMPDWGWIGCLHMIMVFGSISNPKIPGIDHARMRRRSVTAARTLLPQFISKCTISNVRVLLLLSLFLHNNNERNAAWNLVGTATRIAFALGLHRSDMGSNFRPQDREVRKWVFCSLYSFEQFLASSLGRPSGLHEMDVEIVAPREGKLDSAGGGSDATHVALSLKLQGILAKTRFTYARQSPAADVGIEPSTTNDTKPTIEDVLKALTTWRQEVNANANFSLPPVRTNVPVCGSMEDSRALDFETVQASLSWKTRSQLRALLLLHIQYHYIAIVATRPVLLREIAASQTSVDVPMDAEQHAQQQKQREKNMSPVADICLYHACQLTFLVLVLDQYQLVNGLSGLDVFYAYCAAMVLILRLLRQPPAVEGEEAIRADGSRPGLSAAENAREDQIQDLIKNLVLRVQAVINKNEKSGSMRRFAKVVDTFAECTSQTGRQRFEATRKALAVSRQKQSATISSVPTGMPPPGMPVRQEPHIPPMGGMPPGHPAMMSGLGGMPHPSQQQHPHQQVQPHSAHPAHSAQQQQQQQQQEMGMPMPVNLWPLSTFGSSGVHLDDGGFYMNPYNGHDPGAAPEWSDMEMVLASYGIP